MSSSTPNDAVQARLLRDRRKEIVERSSDVCGIERASLSQEDDGRWMLCLEFVPDKSGEANVPVPLGLAIEHVRVHDLENAGSVPFHALEIVPSEDLATIYVVLETGPGWGEEDGGGLFQVVLSGLPNVDPHFAFAEFGYGARPYVGTTQRAAGTRGDSDANAPSTYLSKDDESIQQMMLQRLRKSLPEWQERSAADVGVTMVEGVSHALDLLSYYQDAVGTEAYTDTARHRISLRRHGRMVGVRLSDGAGARTWLSFSVEQPLQVMAGARVGTAAIDQHEPGVSTGSDSVFRTCRAMLADPEQNVMHPHCWGMAPVVLPAGSTTMTLKGHLESLHEGSILFLLEGGGQQDSNRRHAIRLSRPPVLDVDETAGILITQIHWSKADELPFDLRLHDGSSVQDAAIVLGNAVLAQQGEMLAVRATNVTMGANSISVKLSGAGVLCFEPPDYSSPASQQCATNPYRAVPEVMLVQRRSNGRQTVWTAVPDLLQSSPVDSHFVVEMDNQNDLHLRFGDGRLGCPIPPGNELTVLVNAGHGQVGNVGVDALVHVHSDVLGLLAVRNPIPASGGTAPDTMAMARRSVLQRKATVHACVEPDDYARLAETHPQVRQASAVQSWSGTLPVMTVHILPEHGNSAPDSVLADLMTLMERHRRIGVRVEVQNAHVVHVDVALKIMVSNRLPMATIRKRIFEVIGARSSLASGVFSADKLGLGQSAYEAPMVRAVCAVDGVKWSETVCFQRRDQSGRFMQEGVILIQPHEVARMDGGGLQLVLEVQNESQ